MPARAGCSRRCWSSPASSSAPTASLDAVLEETPSPTVMEFRQLLRAEVVRRQVLTEGRVPKFQGEDPTEAQKAAARAVTLLRAGDHAGAAAAAAEVEALRPRVAGTRGRCRLRRFPRRRRRLRRR